ncbi:hypothetical protein TWF751_005815 [Orbilia oligospora]|nr:hypothetical protein TWF751_005815 [Orbilia oligospora]
MILQLLFLLSRVEFQGRAEGKLTNSDGGSPKFMSATIFQFLLLAAVMNQSQCGNYSDCVGKYERELGLISLMRSACATRIEGLTL